MRDLDGLARQVQHYRHHVEDRSYCGISPMPSNPIGPVTFCEPCWEGLMAHRKGRRGQARFM